MKPLQAWGPRAVAICLLLLYDPISAQSVRGLLLDRDSDGPVDLGTITLVTTGLDTLTQTITDENGYFALTAPYAGEFYLYASALGYRPIRSEVFSLDGVSQRVVQLTMAPSPLALAGLLVEADAEAREIPALVRNGFYRRMRVGRGEFITPAQIQASTVAYTQQLFRDMRLTRVFQASHERPGPWDDEIRIVSIERGYCQPSLYIDGIWVRELNEGESIEDAAPKRELEAVEVYRWPLGVPHEYQGSFQCGVILFWTRGL